MAPTTVTRPTPKDGRKRVIIEGVTPEVDGGRFPAKRTIGDIVRVEADLFTDGHDSIAGVLLFRYDKTSEWTEKPMTALVNDRWFCEFKVSELGRYRFTIHAWIDHWETWRRDLLKRIAADTDTPVDYQIGAVLISHAAGRASGADHAYLRNTAAQLNEPANQAQHRNTAIDPKLNETVLRYPDRQFATSLGKELEIIVDPVRARFSSWYEFFPRSASQEPGRHGTFADCEARLPYVAEMGFNVLYFPPIHPIGVQFRKGKNNTVNALEGDVGSPWAIGAAEGGHKSIHPQLGTLDDFRRLVKRPRTLESKSPSTSLFRLLPTIRTSRNMRTGFANGPTARSNTPKTLPRSIRTSTLSTSNPKTGRECGKN